MKTKCFPIYINDIYIYIYIYIPNISIVFCYKYSVSKADFRQAANRCAVVLKTDKRVYTNKVYLQESFTSQKLGSCDFTKKGKFVKPPLSSKLLYLTVLRCSLLNQTRKKRFLKSFARTKILMIQVE